MRSEWIDGYGICAIAYVSCVCRIGWVGLRCMGWDVWNGMSRLLKEKEVVS